MVNFSFGAPVSNENFFNRESELSYLEKRLFAIGKGSRNDIAVIGPRRVGKSSLVLQMAEHARMKGFKSIFIDCEGLGLEGFIKEYGNAVMAAELEARLDLKIREALSGGASMAITALSEILGSIKALELSPVFGDFLKLRLEFEKAAFSNKAHKASVRQLLEATLSLPSKTSSKYVVIFDEFQETAGYSLDQPFHSVYRRVTQFQKNVVYVYSGSSVGMMEDIFGNKKNPLAANADILNVVPFNEQTAKKFLGEGFSSYSRKIDEDALRILWEKTNGFPAYLNWAGLRSLDISGKTIVKADAERIAEEMVSPISPIYQLVEKQLSKLGRISRLVLRSMANGNASPSAIKATTPVKNIYVYLNRLRKYGLVSKTSGEFHIIDPVIKSIIGRYQHY